MSIKLYLIATTVFFAIDMLWLGIIAKNFYVQQIGFLLKTNVNWAAAIIFYLIFIAGLTYFVIAPAHNQPGMTAALLSAAFFGLVTYATYDLTNLATVKDWPLLVTIVDLIWGMVLATSVTGITLLVAQRLGI